MSQRFIAATFIAGLVLGGVAMYGVQPRSASAEIGTQGGPYQLVAYHGAAGDSAWRLNTVSGELVYCSNAIKWGCITAPTPPH